MNTDRFKNYEDDVKQLVLDFESMDKQGNSRFYDVDQIETIIDFYLDTANSEMLEKSVRYGERLFPASNEIRLRRAHLLCFKERYTEALGILKQLLQIEPDDTDVLYALGVVYCALEQPRKAIQYYLQAAADGYELGIIYSNIADEYVKMGHLPEARNYYRRAINVNPDDEHSLYELSNCYEDDGLNDKWIHFFSNFVEEHPYSKVGWFCLGEAYLSVQLYERANDAYQYALAIDETYISAYLQLAEVQWASGETSDAVTTLTHALKHTEDKASLYNRIGDFHRLSETPSLSAAEYYYRKATQEDPYYADAWLNLSITYSAMLLPSPSSAIDAIKHAVKINPESPLYLTTLALIYADYGDFDNAERIFQCAVPYYSDFDHGWIAYADFFILQDRFDEAIEVLSTGITDCELVLEFNKRLAYCYLRTGRRNMLYNAVRACIYDGADGEKELLDYCPELKEDPPVMDILSAHRREIDNR